MTRESHKAVFTYYALSTAIFMFFSVVPSMIALFVGKNFSAVWAPLAMFSEITVFIIILSTFHALDQWSESQQLLNR